jgi:signal transduction histidine kinase
MRRDAATTAHGEPAGDREAETLSRRVVLPSASGSAASDVSLDENVARIHLSLVTEQWRRLPVGTIACNAVIVWAMERAGLAGWAAIWLAADLLLQVARWHVATRRPDIHRTAVGQTRRFTWMFAALGLSRAMLVPLLFSQPLSELHYLYTMVTVGLAAGAVGAVGGLHHAYRVGVGIALLSTAVGWVVLGQVQGFIVAGLLVLLWLVLSAFVRSYGGTLRQLASLADAAHAASRSKTRFFAAASHDLRQPLHALAVNATTLGVAARRIGDTVVIEASDGIDRALAQSNGLLDSLLEISRLDAQSMTVDIEPVDARRLLEQVCDEFQPIARERGLRLTVAAASAPDRPIATDRQLMARVLANLVSNALKFTARGEVVLSMSPAEGHLLITVADTGCGIAESEHARVFEEFYQAGNRPRNPREGLGLGLSIVQRSCALLAVEVALHSRLGEGTRVELRVPMA